MTTDSRQRAAMTAAASPSIHVTRARRLLYGGLTGGVAAAVACLLVFALLHGAAGMISVSLGAGCVLFFYTVGQLVMVMFADAGARTLLAVSMASYTARVVLLGLLLLLYSTHRSAWPALLPMGVFVATIVTVAGWLVAEVLVFSRLRIGHYDTEYEAPQVEERP